VILLLVAIHQDNCPGFVVTLVALELLRTPSFLDMLLQTSSGAQILSTERAEQLSLSVEK
jgi:hypothetical protein